MRVICNRGRKIPLEEDKYSRFIRLLKNLLVKLRKSRRTVSLLPDGSSIHGTPAMTLLDLDLGQAGTLFDFLDVDFLVPVGMECGRWFFSLPDTSGSSILRVNRFC